MFPKPRPIGCARKLTDRTVAQLPRPRISAKHDRDRPIVDPDATALQVAAVMTRQQSPMVAVVQNQTVLVITVQRLLRALLPDR